MIKETTKNTHKNAQVSYESKSSLMPEELLKSLFDEKEIYDYTTSISNDYKEFKDEVILHLKFLQKQCDEGIKNGDIKTLNGINNYITSFLIRNHLINNEF